ncbi:hypothetical protein ACFLV0_04865 [Chloroflexota bacterium]
MNTKKLSQPTGAGGRAFAIQGGDAPESNSGRVFGVAKILVWLSGKEGGAGE